MEILQKNDDKKGMFYVVDNQQTIAEMTYVWDGDKKIIIEHTEVDDSFNGKGIGKQMVEKAVNFARKKSIKIIPLCPFVKSVFDKVVDFKDVLN
jgi:uncharacterized protein